MAYLAAYGTCAPSHAPRFDVLQYCASSSSLMYHAILTVVMWQVREYMFQLEAHLAEAHRQAQRLIKQQGLLGHSLAEFGTSIISLGKFEQGRLADDFINLGEKAESLARSSQVRPDPACMRLPVELLVIAPCPHRGVLR